MDHFGDLCRMSIAELQTLQDGCQQSVEACRARKQWALAWWWRKQENAIGEELFKAHMEQADSRFVRSQLALPGMPGRVAPDDRGRAA